MLCKAVQEWRSSCKIGDLLCIVYARMEVGKQRMEGAVHCCARMELNCAMLCKNGDY